MLLGFIVAHILVNHCSEREAFLSRCLRSDLWPLLSGVVQFRFCLSVICLSVWLSDDFQKDLSRPRLQSSFSLIRYTGHLSSWYMKVIGSRSRLQEQKRSKIPVPAMLYFDCNNSVSVKHEPRWLQFACSVWFSTTVSISLCNRQMAPLADTCTCTLPLNRLLCVLVLFPTFRYGGSNRCNCHVCHVTRSDHAWSITNARIRGWSCNCIVWHGTL